MASEGRGRVKGKEMGCKDGFNGLNPLTRGHAHGIPCHDGLACVLCNALSSGDPVGVRLHCGFTDAPIWLLYSLPGEHW